MGWGVGVERERERDRERENLKDKKVAKEDDWTFFFFMRLINPRVWREEWRG